VSKPPVVIIGYGNPSRGDDALGPRLIEQLEQTQQENKQQSAYELITDFQLQIEHATDLQARNLLLFIDASHAATPPFEFSKLTAQKDHSYSSHSLSPTTLLSVFEQVYQQAPPPAYLLSIPGYQFELGQPLSEQTASHLAEAYLFTYRLLTKQTEEHWDQMIPSAVMPRVG
jgi:hydrogenase maturation protease